jgi:hypothetical protein
MALGTLGTTSTTVLKALNAWGQNLSDADIAAISQSISSDFFFASVLQAGVLGPSGILATGATHASTTLDTLVTTGGGGLATIQRGMLVLAADVTPGTYVADILSPTSVLLSQAATGSNAERVAFVNAPAGPGNIDRTQSLVIPNRGTLTILPGDVVAIDNTGWPILVSGVAIG